MAAIPKLNEANLEALSDILGATDTGLTGSEIGRYLGECDCPDPIPNMTKRHRLKAACRRQLLPCSIRGDKERRGKT
jgi:hypothetical protein